MRFDFRCVSGCDLHVECNDPISRSFSLSQQAKAMAGQIPEYKEEYTAIAKKCIELPIKLLSLCENMSEVEVFLKETCGSFEHIYVYDTNIPRILLAFENNNRDFVTNSYCQQVLLILRCQYVFIHIFFLDLEERMVGEIQ